MEKTNYYDPRDTEETRRAAVSARCTLNGRPAQISGVMLKFATVSDNDGRRGEWAWTTVYDILAKGGKFKM